MLQVLVELLTSNKSNIFDIWIKMSYICWVVKRKRKFNQALTNHLFTDCLQSKQVHNEENTLAFYGHFVFPNCKLTAFSQLY